MKSTLIKRVLVASLAAIAASSAGAVDLREVHGTNVVFYYDADLWGANAFSVVGNTISFDVSGYLDLSATSPKNSISKYDSIELRNNVSALVVVANNGYKLGPQLSYGVSSGSATLGNGFANTTLTLDVQTGNVINGSFLATSYLQTISTGNSVISSGSLVSNGTYNLAASTQQTLGLGATLFSDLKQVGLGVSTSSVNEVTFGISVTAVPEPKTYLMLGAGLGLVGFAARRRKQQA